MTAMQTGHRVVIQAPDHDMIHTPVFLDFPDGTFEAGVPICVMNGTEVHPAQLEITGQQEQRIWWIASQPAGSRAEVSITSGEECPQPAPFTWESITSESRLLVLDAQPVLQYEFPEFDPDDIEHTKKPYHHVFDPGTGEKITKGVGGLYSHHRGIFFGYNHIYVDGGDEQIDIWHANYGERSEHLDIITEFTGPVFGGHIVRIQWKDHDGQPFADELREIRVFRQPEGELLIDFRSKLHALAGHVRLDGDRQHAGVQFRASQYVADHPEHSRYIRPDAWSHLQPEEEIGDDNNTDFGWNAFHFRIEDRPYTVSYLSHHSNPSPAEMSERLYGRFGEFFRYELTPENPLKSRYRFWITTGEPPAKEQIRNRYETYIHKPELILQ